MKKSSDITIAICAYNAEKTIERAIKSACSSADCPILLVDDYSTDRTVALAKSIAGSQLTIVRPAQKIGIGNARQTAIENIKTHFGMWLDADDEIFPERPMNMLQVFEQHNADLVFDAGELVDEKTGNIISQLPMPEFLFQPGIHRLFERNWLPGLWGGFRVAFAKNVGYDRTFLNSEDYDFTLRAIIAGARVQLMNEYGYRYYHSHQTISRNLQQATQFTRDAIAKHSLADIQKHFSNLVISSPEQSFLLCSVALMSGRYTEATEAAENIERINHKILPYNLNAESLTAFLAASAQLKLGNPDYALHFLQSYEGKTAEWANNVGVCHILKGKPEAAKAYFEQALEFTPGFNDAAQNLKELFQATPPHITLQPLRPLASRSVY